VICTTCGSANPFDARYCGRCGEALELTCGSCGGHLEPGLSFCTSCGARVGEFVAAQAAEERKVVTALFVDLVGFTGRAEQLDPEDVRSQLQLYYARVRRELERFGGTVEKFIGDAVMALFGAPVSHDDDPARAVMAALAIRDALTSEAAGVRLQVRIGVHTGEALVSLGGHAARGEGMAAGDVLNTASRLQTAAPINGVLVGERTCRATKHEIEYRNVEPLRAKGKAEPLRVFEAVGPKASPDETERDVPLVGRRDELALLLGALARVHRKRSAELVTLVGVPGIGKSRLVMELREAAELDGRDLRWLHGRTHAYGSGGAFVALTDIVKTELGIAPAVDGATAEQTLRETLGGLRLDAAERRWVEMHLRVLLGLAADEEAPGGWREAFAAWGRFLQALAERTPVVLVFEDLHWADSALLDFVDELVERLAAVPLLVVATARPELLEQRPGWGRRGKRNAFIVSLSALSDDQTATLLSMLLRAAKLPEETQRTLVARIGGNPLYAGEYVRMLIDRGFLREDGETLSLERAQELPMPDSVQGIVAARLDALPPEEKTLVQDAAVLGESFSVDALASLAGVDVAEAEERANRLVRKELLRRIRRTAAVRKPQYAFGHVLLRDVSYGQIPRGRRAEKHWAAAEWLTNASASPVGDQAEALAHHYLTALEYARAAGTATEEHLRRARTALRDAGDRASTLNAHGAAARFYAAALELGTDDEADRFDLLFQLGTALSHAEQEGVAELEEARDGLLANGNLERAAEAGVTLYKLLTGKGERVRAREHLERAGAILEHARPSRSKASVLSATSRSLMQPGKEEQAVAIGRQAAEMAEQLGLDDLRAHALNNIGFARVTAGDLGGVADLERSVQIASDLNSLEVVRGYRFLGAALSSVGELRRSFELYELGRREAERFGDAFNRRWLLGAQAIESYWTGRWDEAERLAAEFVVASAAGAHHYLEALCRHVRGEVLLARGRTEAARVDADVGLGFARTAGDVWLLHPALAFGARAVLAAGDRCGAAALATELVERWRESGAIASYWTADLAFVLDALGRGEELLEAAARIDHPTRWLEAARAFLEGDLVDAAQRYAEIGSRPDEAFVRLRSAEHLPPDGRAHDADLERAVAFYESVGAAAHLRRAKLVASPR
jgi:class 3 adenylate cyclase